MKGLADAEIYEQELNYWPYKTSLRKVIASICKHAPRNGTVLDLMCGPGYLLKEIAKKRKDLMLKGVDIDNRYIAYAKKRYPSINFEKGDVLKWKSKELFDVVVCTGSLHHIPYALQEKAVKRMADLTKQEGLTVLSDCHVDDYSNELQRKLAAAKLGYEYLKETLKNKAPQPAIESTIDILWNDVLMHEFKTSFKKRLSVYKKYFKGVQTFKTWPNFKSEYGDYVSFCTKRQLP
ncbi:class I SAM-dependent methyltransferase [Candidatus Woesearchaeota archaeon]|nr:MAG: class I SAM-dependent methyltransferase [Candidatus Woesearchaeota archaeon]